MKEEERGKERKGKKKKKRNAHALERKLCMQVFSFLFFVRGRGKMGREVGLRKKLPRG